MKAVILKGDSTPWFSDSTIELNWEPRLLNRPFLDWQLDALRRGGVSETCVVHLGRQQRLLPLRNGVVSCTQQVPMGSAGSLVPLRGWLADEPFVLVFASTFVDERCVRGLLDSAVAGDERWAGTVAIIQHRNGFDADEGIAVDGEGRLRTIYRQHRSLERRASRYPAGLFLLSAKALAAIPAAQYYDLKDQLFPQVQAHGLYLSTCLAQHSRPVLRGEDYLKLQLRLMLEDPLPRSERGPNGVAIDPNARLLGDVVLGAGSTVGPGAQVIGPVLFGRDCDIGAGAVVVGPAVVGDGCRMGENAWLQSSVLDDGVLLEPGSRVDYCLLGRGHRVPRHGRRRFVDGLCRLSSGTLRSLPAAGYIEAAMRTAPAARDIAWSVLYGASKRVFDFIVAGLLMLLLLPLFAVVALAVKLDSAGPVFFVQRRCGRDGREFPLIKFRTMTANADSMQHALRHANQIDGPTFKLDRDPRVTRVGRWLRQTSMDELPQLLNVLLGHMSLVGPRPLRMKEMVCNPHWRDSRLSVPPGLTGLWQVEGRHSHNFYHWVELDLAYVRKRSFWLDLKILAKTFAVLLKGT